MASLMLPGNEDEDEEEREEEGTCDQLDWSKGKASGTEGGDGWRAKIVKVPADSLPMASLILPGNEDEDEEEREWM